ncbi:carbohydrate esterase family 3 protein [Zopfia rhizophila CBS 207.26]|uniref:Carbohydrate esterase family 3 protein n=1 Tax=Zopfia rhizophila CBS 207.26 TaxID=1314779 RepID=A0A6A6DX20_9PEZI|nr:carbohydrate esterase family 3 protein [Zopfia rhizophila CBS 207.26]
MVQLRTLAALCSVILPVLAQTKLRYMPFGDSITEFGCWRAFLWQKLQQDGYTNVDFVGSMTSQTQCSGINYDKNHEGHAGYQAVNIANQNQLVGWLQRNPADIITMHLGTNDANARRSTQDVINSFSKMVDQMRAANPRMRIIVAKIIPLPSNNQPIVSLNNAIPAWATSKNTTDSPIWVVDQYTGFTSSDLGDGVHPNTSGDRKMTEVWYPALVGAIKSLQVAAKREVEFKA